MAFYGWRSGTGATELSGTPAGSTLGCSAPRRAWAVSEQLAGFGVPEALCGPVVSSGDFETAYFLRMEAVDRPGVLADVTRIFGDLDISIEAILQKEPVEQNTAQVIMLTQATRENRMAEALVRLEALDAILGRVKRIRMESLD